MTTFRNIANNPTKRVAPNAAIKREREKIERAGAIERANQQEKAELEAKYFKSPAREKARLLTAINAVLETKSTPELAAILTTLKGISDKKIKYPQIKRAQSKFSKLLEQSEIQN